MDLERIVQAAIQVERAGAGLYDKAARHAEDRDVLAVFSWLAGQEKQHAEALIRRFKVAPGRPEDEENVPLIQKIRDTIERMEKAPDILGVVEFGIQLEKAAEKFYRDLAGYIELEEEFAQFLGDTSTGENEKSAGAGVRELVEWEARHAKRLETLKRALQARGYVPGRVRG